MVVVVTVEDVIRVCGPVLLTKLLQSTNQVVLTGKTWYIQIRQIENLNKHWINNEGIGMEWGYCVENFSFQISVKNNFSCNIVSCCEFLQTPAGDNRLLSGDTDHCMTRHWIFTVSKPEENKIVVGDNSQDKKYRI